jgi:hypothetical protein
MEQIEERQTGMARTLRSLLSAAGWLDSPRRRHVRAASKARAFRFETLEPRVALAAAGLVPVGAQPVGPLTGKIVYTSPGHGWQWNSNLNRWATDRGDNNEIVEDFGNQDQMTFYVDYLLRAGATVVPMRPVGHQLNEVVLDNDSPGVTFSGAWSNSSQSRFYDEDYGATPDAVPYRFASTAAGSETAVATYTPNIPEAGFYPIYTWVLAGTDRTNQLYKINHTGGQTQLRVDHSKVGGGWVYLGTYYFAAGSSATTGSVQISNQGPAGKVVIADAIRFGNGMGDVKDGPGGVGAASGQISGYPREDENSLMWLWRSVGQGVNPASVVGTGNVSAPARMAEWMNVNSNAFGTSVYIGFHSNAGGGRGAVGLISNSGNSFKPTPNQAALALYTGRQINQDMQALNGVFEHNWSTRTTHTYTAAFGEINDDDFINSSGVVEMDATIIEVGFHDNLQDAQLMRDPKVRDQLARSTYEATLEYFDNFGGLTAPVAVASAPTNVSVASQNSGEVTLRWTAGPTGVRGGVATGYRIYASTNGYGFDGGTYVAGGATSAATLSGYDPTIPYYFKVVAVNAGGESLGSEVIAVLPSGGAKQVLIVNGFDRNERSQNVRYPYAYVADGLVDRVGARYNNSFDYVIQVATAIQTAAAGVHFASASNEAVISGAVNLSDYRAVVWILGEESTADRTFDAVEQAKVDAFIAGGGHLFTSGAEIAWDLDQQNNGRSFFENTLKGNYVADDANTYNVTATGGGIFAGLSFSFDNGAQFYNTDYPDVIAPQPGAVQALAYSGGTGGSAGIQLTGSGGRGSVVVFGFPFETITTAANRAAVMDRVLGFFGVAPIVPSGDFTGDGVVDGADFLAWQRGFGAANPVLADGDANVDGSVDAADLATWAAQFGGAAPGESVQSANGVAAVAAPEPQLATTSQAYTLSDELSTFAFNSLAGRVSFAAPVTARPTVLETSSRDEAFALATAPVTVDALRTDSMSLVVRRSMAVSGASSDPETAEEHGIVAEALARLADDVPPAV